MKTSETIAKLAAALAKAQAEVEGAAKDSKNPHFNSKYADLASVRDACLPHLNKHGLSVVQLPFTEGAVVRLETVLLHESGEWLSGDPLGAQGKDSGPQTVGSCITYLRRYALAAIAGVAPEDDDAEAAQGRGTLAATMNAAVKTGYDSAIAPKGYHDWLTKFGAVIEKGIDPLRDAWKLAPQEFRDHLTRTDPKRWEGMKAAAQATTDNAKAKPSNGAAA